MTRPKRPPVLVIALVVLPLAALLFAAAETNVGGSASNTTLGTLALLMAVLAIRFNWARVTAVVLLLLLTAMWLPGALERLGSENMVTRDAAIYVVMATVLTVGGSVLAFLTPSNAYYERAKQWRTQSRVARQQARS